jgi:hypothetical protein
MTSVSDALQIAIPAAVQGGQLIRENNLSHDVPYEWFFQSNQMGNAEVLYERNTLVSPTKPLLLREILLHQLKIKVLTVVIAQTQSMLLKELQVVDLHLPRRNAVLLCSTWMELLHLLRLRQVLPSTCCYVHCLLLSNSELKAAALELVKLRILGAQVTFELLHAVSIEGEP